MDHRLTRDKAKDMRIEEAFKLITQRENNGEFVEKLFAEFQESWKKVANTASQYGCKHLDIIKARIERDDPLAFVLTDKAELGYGMYMAAALEQLSLAQNTFLTKVCDELPDAQYKTILDGLRKDRHQLPIQNANEAHIVSVKSLKTSETHNLELLSFALWNPSIFAKDQKS